MKYPQIGNEILKQFDLGPFNMGVDLSKSPGRVDKGSLTECNNVYFSNGVLKTRPGIQAEKENVVESVYTDEAFFNNYKISDTEVHIENEFYRIITEISESGLSEYYASVFLISREREIRPIGCFEFKRTSESVFYIPSNITFFQAKKTSGKGIYAFITKSNMEDYTQELYEIYELNSNMDNWEKIEDFYVPTVYINGRGNMYEKAEAENNAYTGTPQILQSPNLLNGKFYAYFSSDGYSSSFQLPFAGLAKETVICRVYHSESSYMDWEIAAGKKTAKATFMGAEVTANLDRNKGIIFFTVSTGEYAVPFMNNYKANNIKITAYKKMDADFGDIVSSRCCAVTDSKILLSGGRIPNRVFVADYDNPFYFPQDSMAVVGESNLAVTALKVQADKVIAFKRKGIYRISIKKGGVIKNNSLLSDNGDVFYESDILTVNSISNKVGCYSSVAITSYCEKAVFIGSDSNIYVITSPSKIVKISNKISPFLNNFPSYSLQDAVALRDGEYCYFFIDNSAVALRFNNETLGSKDAVWYLWQLPQTMRIAGGLSGDISPVLVCVNGYNTCYLAVFGGSTDMLINRIMKEDENADIKSSFTSSHFLPDGKTKKNLLKNVCLNLSLKGIAEIGINGKKYDFTRSVLNRSGYAKVTVFTGLKPFESFWITVSAEKGMSFDSSTVTYIQRG